MHESQDHCCAIKPNKQLEIEIAVAENRHLKSKTFKNPLIHFAMKQKQHWYSVTKWVVNLTYTSTCAFISCLDSYFSLRFIVKQKRFLYLSESVYCRVVEFPSTRATRKINYFINDLNKYIYISRKIIGNEIQRFKPIGQKETLRSTL